MGSLWRRCVDWLDWMLVEAWNVEHNQLHHYYLGEVSDPDLVEHNLAFLRGLRLPPALKYAAVVPMALIWKWWYYAPNTFKVLKLNQLRRVGKLDALREQCGQAQLDEPCLVAPDWLVATLAQKPFSALEFFSTVLAPFLVQRFVLAPLAVGMVLGEAAGRSTFANLVLGELATNAWAFAVIVTNHAGDDLYRFEKHCAPRSGTYFMRQVVSTANYAQGGDLNDFVHGFLNYQVTVLMSRAQVCVLAYPTCAWKA